MELAHVAQSLQGQSSVVALSTSALILHVVTLLPNKVSLPSSLDGYLLTSWLELNRAGSCERDGRTGPCESV